VEVVINDPATAVDPAALQVAPPQAVVTPTRIEPYARPVYAQTTKGRRWWTASLALAVLVTGGALALLYNDDHAFQNQARSLTTDNESLQGQIIGIQGDLTASKASLATTQADLAAVRAQLAHPVLGIWNVRQTLHTSTEYLAAGVPDTFTYHLHLKSTGTMNVSILSFDQFSAAVTCIQNGVGDTNWCMHHSGTGTAYSQLGVTSVSYDFHLAEGCAAYMVVITAPSQVTITPDVSVTYNPASKATGTCA
jgi:hypothetical protein